MKENGFNLAKERSWRYPAQAITDAENADAIALLANTSTQAETLLHSLERAAIGVGLHVNADKTEDICFNLKGDISTLKGGPLKLVNKDVMPHQPRKTSTCDQQRYGQLSIIYRSYESQTWPIK